MQQAPDADAGVTAGARIRRADDGALECVLALDLEQRVAAVWQALTGADALPQWLAPGTIEPRPGGAVRIAFEVSGEAIDSRVTVWEPESRLAYAWSSAGQPPRPVEWRLTPTPAGTTLDLRVAVPADEDAARAFAGWSAHLQMLGAYLAGAPIGFPVQHFRTVRDALGAQLAAL